jgi:hypothetical protein
LKDFFGIFFQNENFNKGIFYSRYTPVNKLFRGKYESLLNWIEKLWYNKKSRKKFKRMLKNTDKWAYSLEEIVREKKFLKIMSKLEFMQKLELGVEIQNDFKLYFVEKKLKFRSKT